jgi:acyl-coenzyme A thioesterase PaaI-like protein
VLASHISVNCLAPARGDAFVARARVVKAGRRQVFARAELFAVRDDAEQLVATGDVILVPLAAGGDGAFTHSASARSPADASVR